MQLTLSAARALRDGGIDAMAALEAMLIETLEHLPEAQHADMKRLTGRLMGAVAKETIDKAIMAFAELNPDDDTWVEVAIGKALGRSAAP